MKNIEVKVHYNSIIAKILTLQKGLNVITLGNHIFCERDGISPLTLNHELIHVCQYNKFGMLKFLWIYLFKEFFKSYREKSFEIEAYNNQANYKYIKEAYPEFNIQIDKG